MAALKENTSRADPLGAHSTQIRALTTFATLLAGPARIHLPVPPITKMNTRATKGVEIAIPADLRQLQEAPSFHTLHTSLDPKASLLSANQTPPER